MKRLIFTVLAIFCFVLTTSAQVPKGTILAGVSSNIGFSNYKPDGGKTISGFNSNVNGGYFLIDNLVGGVNLGVGHSDNGTTTFNSTTMGLFARYYFMGKIFVGGGFNANNSKSESGGVSSKSSYTTVNATAGYAWFIIPSIAVEPSLNLNIDGGDVKGVGFGARVGFTLYLNRKDK